MCACMCLRRWRGFVVVSREFVSRLGWFSTEMYMRFKLHACSSLFSTPPPSALSLSFSSSLSSGILSQLQAQKHSLPSLFSLIISLTKETAKKDSYMLLTCFKTLIYCIIVIGLRHLQLNRCLKVHCDELFWALWTSQ